MVRFIADMLETKAIVPKSPPKDHIGKSQPDGGKLELVDLRIEDGHFPSQMLDLKLRNIGSKVAYLTRAIIRVEKTWKISPVSWLMAAVGRSEEYDVRFSRANTPYSVTVSLSQAIPAGDVDRFALRLLMDTANNDSYEYAVRFRVRLEYDGDAKVLETGEILYWQYGGLDHPYVQLYNHPSEGIERYFGQLGWIVENNVRHDVFDDSEEWRQLLLQMSQDALTRNLDFIAEATDPSIIRSKIADRRLSHLNKASAFFKEVFNEHGRS